jgi:hypothetical protein
MRIGATASSAAIVMTALLLAPQLASAGDRQVRPFLGATFGAGTSFLTGVRPDESIGKNLVVGASAVFIGEIFGVEADVADVGGFFESDNSAAPALVSGSRVTTFTGNIVIAAPHKMTEYSLRPYVVGGGGLMRIRTTTSLNIFDVATFLPSFDVGAGVVGFLTNRAGIAWEVRRFQSLGGNKNNGGLSLGPEDLSFWRATMSVALRY